MEMTSKLSYNKWRGLKAHIYNKAFVKFLKDHKAYHKYFINLRRSREDIHSFLNDLVMNDQAQELIVYAFGWSATAEGSGFWSNLHKKWVSIANTIRDSI
jgi:hypothetical protein